MYLMVEVVFLWYEFSYLYKQPMGSNPKCFLIYYMCA